MLPTKIDCTTSILYGVFASEKSYLLGIRVLIKREHARMLASKVSKGRLAQELADMIESCLFVLEKEMVRNMWGRMVEASREEKLDKFSFHDAETLAEREVFRRLQFMRVKVTPISNDRPFIGSTKQPNTAHYVHLSATKTRPSINIQLPSDSIIDQLPPPSQTFRSLQYLATRGGFLAACGTLLSRYVFQNQTLKIDKCTYFPSRISEVAHKALPPVTRYTARVLQCENVEEAMREWDSEALKTFVELLELHVLPFDDREALKPGLHIWQQVGEEA